MVDSSSRSSASCRERRPRPAAGPAIQAGACAERGADRQPPHRAELTGLPVTVSQGFWTGPLGITCAVTFSIPVHPVRWLLTLFEAFDASLIDLNGEDIQLSVTRFALHAADDGVGDVVGSVDRDRGGHCV